MLSSYWRIYGISHELYTGFCFVSFCSYNQLLFMHVICLHVFFNVSSLALGAIYDCPNIREVTLEDMGKTTAAIVKPQQNNSWLCAQAMRDDVAMSRRLSTEPIPRMIPEHTNRSAVYACRNRFVNAPSQWEMTLQCNVVSHWLGAFTKWSTCMRL